MKTNQTLHVIAFTLTIAGSINWGLVGLLNLNLVSMIFRPFGLEGLVYILVGVSALYIVLTHQQDCKTCSVMMKKPKKK